MNSTDYSTLPDRIKKIYDECTPEEQSVLLQILQEIVDTGSSPTYENIWLQDYKEIPVDKYTFLTDSEFLGETNNNGTAIYPAWMDTMLELESTKNQYFEIALTGATRTGKTTTAVSDALYHLYRLMCLKNPQSYYGLKSITNISFFFFNITQTLAKSVAFREFNTSAANSKWFMEHGKMSKSEANPTYIPEGGLISIEYGSDASHALGRATFCVIFDECNFAAAGIKDVNKAKARMKEKYDTLVARVTGTFVKHGEVFGRLYIISSKRSDSDFMEEYIQKQRDAGNKHMYVFDKPQWEVWPKSKYSSDKVFHVALGGKHKQTFVVQDESVEALAELREQGYDLLEVPEDNKVRFLSDLDVALRDIAGVSIAESLSFITQATLDSCIGIRKNPFYQDVLQIGAKDNYFIEEFFHSSEIEDPFKRYPMYVDVDLSLNDDKTGISGVWLVGRTDIINEADVKVSLPIFKHAFTVSLKAPKGDKIPYMKIKSFLLWLRKTFDLERVSRDQFQSEYLAQVLESEGIAVDKLSVDRTPDGYIAFRSVLNEQRIDLLHVELLEYELTHLIRDSVTGKIDHPTGGCFTDDTLIRLVDGRDVSIHDLMLEQSYKSNWVYTINEQTQRIEPKRINSVFQTKIVNELMEVELDNGDIIHCTPDHKFMLRDGNFEEIQNLQENDSLMPLYVKVSSKGLMGYRLYYEPSQDCWHYEHRHFCKHKIHSSNYVVHHCNYNKLDNRPTNLRCITKSEHRCIHNNHTQDYSKVSRGLSDYFRTHKDDPSFLSRNAKIRDKIMLHYDKDRALRRKQHSYKERIRNIESTFDVIWNELSTSDKNRYSQKYSRMKDPTIVQRISDTLSLRHSEGTFKNAVIALSNRRWITNGLENRYPKIDENFMMPEGYHWGRTISEDSINKMMQTRKNWTADRYEAYCKNQSKASSNKIWITDGSNDRLICKDLEVPEGFHRGRSKYKRNHKIISIRRIHKVCKVYDLEIEDNHNFALASGVFVHNSKDSADSLARCVWNAILHDDGVKIASSSKAKAISAINGIRSVNNSKVSTKSNGLGMFPSYKKF